RKTRDLPVAARHEVQLPKAPQKLRPPAQKQLVHAAPGKVAGLIEPANQRRIDGQPPEVATAAHLQAVKTQTRALRRQRNVLAARVGLEPVVGPQGRDGEPAPIEPELIIPGGKVYLVVDGMQDRSRIAVMSRGGNADPGRQLELEQRRGVKKPQRR